MEKQYGPSVEENVNAIYELLYLPNLDDTMRQMLSMYLSAYNQTSEEYSNKKIGYIIRSYKLCS